MIAILGGGALDLLWAVLIILAILALFLYIVRH